MNFRNNKGITGIDISIALIIMVLFVSLVSSLVYNHVVTSRGINRKATATNVAVNKIEELKLLPYTDLADKEGVTTQYATQDGQLINSEGTTGPYKVITEIAKYKNSIFSTDVPDRDNLQDVIEIVNVKVEYTVGNKNEKVEITTAITKED